MSFIMACMSISSKSPRKVALAALSVGKDALPDHSHRFAPKTYTQPQLFACLVLKRFFKTDYRGIAELLADATAIRQAIGLKRVPHFTTLQKAERRLLQLPQMRRLLNGSVRLVMRYKHEVQRVAADSTGLQAGHVSQYFVRRRAAGTNQWQHTTYRRFPKIAMIGDTASHLILSIHTGLGPRPDVDELARLLDELCPHVRVSHLLADAGYDSEWNHVYARDYHGILTTIPARVGRPTDKPPAGKYRRLMHDTFSNRPYYGQRWQIETINSMIKRNQDDAIHAVHYHAQQRELRLAALTHNIAILLRCFKPSFSTEHS